MNADRRPGYVPEESNWRLVFVGGVAPVAYVWPDDAGKYDRAQFQFELQPDQRLPRVEPGGRFRAFGAVVNGGTPTFSADGVDVSPLGALVATNAGPMLVERGAVVAHPKITGPHPGWRYLESHSFDSVESWDTYIARRVKLAHWSLVLAVVFLAAYAAMLVVSRTGMENPMVARGTGFAILDLLLALGALGIAHRARQARRSAEELRDLPAEPMFMHLWWSAGHGTGPLAVASLRRPGQIVDQKRVPVIGVPEELLDVDAPLPVTVRGFDSDAPLIEWEGHLLWPAERDRVDDDFWWWLDHPFRHGSRVSSYWSS